LGADEESVEEYLYDRCLACSRFSKAEMLKSKTPDFKIFKDNDFSFYCEVKTSKEDNWLDKQIQKVRAGYITGGLRADPIFNRLTDDIHTSIKQFDAVNPNQQYPNVLAIVNHDSNCGFLDLLAVLTGNFYDDNGNAHLIYRKFSKGRIEGENERIHLYIWIDEFKPDRLLFSQTEESHHLKLCQLFEVNPDDVVQVAP